MPDLPRHPLDKCGDVPLVPRSQIKLADYNPRIIDADEKRRLKKSLEANGLSEPFVWNRNTGVLIGGHQRLSILDKSSPADDWAVPVIIRELSEVEEKQLNVALNNQKAAGRYDDFKLGELLKTPNIDIAATGFDLGQIKTILPTVAPLIPAVASVLATNADKWKQEKVEQRQREDAAVQRIYDGNQIGDKDEAKILADDDQFYFCVVFKNFADKMKCLEQIGIDAGERFLKGEVVEKVVGYAIEKGYVIENGQADSVESRTD